MIKFQSNTEDVGNLIVYIVTVDPSEDLVAHPPKESSEPWLTQRTSLSVFTIEQLFNRSYELTELKDRASTAESEDMINKQTEPRSVQGLLNFESVLGTYMLCPDPV